MDIKHEPQPADPPKFGQSDSDVDGEMRRISRKSFFWALVAVGGTYGAFHWLDAQAPLKGEPEGLIWPLRRAEQLDDRITSSIYLPRTLAKTYPDSAITEARENGDIGLDDNLDPIAWKLHVEGVRGGPLALDLAAIKALPREEYVAEFKCIEGWSYFMKWAGARFADFHAKYPPAGDPKYVALETPGAKPMHSPPTDGSGGYYISLDLPAALHPQTLLCYEMNGKPLTFEHGAPLRLIIPHKYGVKNLKRIGTIRYRAEQPLDYWGQQGYDTYLGL